MSGIAKMSIGKRFLVNAEENSVPLIFLGMVLLGMFPQRRWGAEKKGRLQVFDPIANPQRGFAYLRITFYRDFSKRESNLFML